jgi:hypothetical protein
MISLENDIMIGLILSDLFTYLKGNTISRYSLAMTMEYDVLTFTDLKPCYAVPLAIYNYKAPYNGRPITAIGTNAMTYQEQVERLIDEQGLETMLSTVSEICGAKAEHIATSWQDTGLAKRWDRMATLLGLQLSQAAGL